MSIPALHDMQTKLDVCMFDDTSLEGKDNFLYVISSSLNSLGTGMVEESQFSAMGLHGTIMLSDA
jgi:hypothetical protein